jgi:DNA-binding CsgD family transcriptional regulator
VAGINERVIGASFTLTPRQAQVLQLLVWDSSTREIARHLRISARTVEGHLAVMRRQVGCATLAGLAAWAVAAEAAAPPHPTTKANQSVMAPESLAGDALLRDSRRACDVHNGSTREPGPQRPRGRPRLMTPDVIIEARRLLTTMSFAQTSRQLGVSRSTLYACLNRPTSHSEPTKIKSR